MKIKKPHGLDSRIAAFNEVLGHTLYAAEHSVLRLEEMAIPYQTFFEMLALLDRIEEPRRTEVLGWMIDNYCYGNDGVRFLGRFTGERQVAGNA